MERKELYNDSLVFLTIINSVWINDCGYNFVYHKYFDILKPEVILENQIYVVREQIRDQESNHCYDVEHTKTNDDHFVVLISKAKILLEKLDKKGTYSLISDAL